MLLMSMSDRYLGLFSYKMVNDASVKLSARGPRATGVCGRSDVNTGFDLNNSVKYLHGKSA